MNSMLQHHSLNIQPKGSLILITVFTQTDPYKTSDSEALSMHIFYAHYMKQFIDFAFRYICLYIEYIEPAAFIPVVQITVHFLNIIPWAMMNTRYTIHKTLENSKESFLVYFKQRLSSISQERGNI